MKSKYLKLLAYQHSNGEMISHRNIWCYIKINKELLDALIQFKGYIHKFKKDKNLLSIEFKSYNYPFFIEIEPEETFDDKNFKEPYFQIQYSLPENYDLYEKSIEKLDSYKIIFTNGWFYIQGFGKWSGTTYETEYYNLKNMIKNIKKNLLK